MIIAFDVETALTDGTPSVEYYRDDFRVISAAFAWRKGGEMRTLYLEGEDEVRTQLGQLPEDTQLVVHNFQFEAGVTMHRFPGFEHLITYDTMRLVQVADNGGRQASWQPKVVTDDDILDASGADAAVHTSGLGLVASASRWLPPEWQNHKEPYHKWLRDQGVKKGQEGAHLTSLPPDMLEAYNVADAQVTLLLYETLNMYFLAQGYDPGLDHELYKSTARMVAKAKGIGARVETEALAKYAATVEAEIAAIEQEFRASFKEPLLLVESSMHTDYVQNVKTLKAQERRAAEDMARLNLGSNKQLKELFVNTLGITPKFWTKPPKGRKPDAKEFIPSPSFKAAHLSTYGEGGELLIKRRKRLLVLQQCRSLLKLAERDGRWHWDVRAAGTATGRMAAGAGG